MGCGKGREVRLEANTRFASYSDETYGARRSCQNGFNAVGSIAFHDVPFKLFLD